MNVQRRNEALIYCLSSGPTIPEWLGERARRNLSKRDESIRRRIELIQDFQMPSSSTKLVQSSDGRYIMAAGTYPPRVRCYDVHELSMKFERYLNAHVTDLVMLSDDYGKMALLLDDRTIAFHAPYGAHESIRIPTFGRAMAYEPTSCEILVAAKGSQLYRVNLEEGRFSEPWSIDKSTSSSTCIAVSPTHPLALVGCDDGVVRFWDNRSPDSLLKPFLSLDVGGGTKGFGYADNCRNSVEIRSIAQDPSGMFLAAGTVGGIVALYDVRSSRPLHVMEHKQGMPIHTIKFHPFSGCILSGDEKLVKVWRYKSSSEIVGDDRTGSIGSVVVNVEGTGKFSHFIVAGDETDPTGNRSGLLLCATDEPKMESFYIPSVGIAPKWCSFLENITEELEERDVAAGNGAGADAFIQDGGQETVFENYKFVTRDEVESLGISNLVGTPLLRGYMHGFFMDIQLYNRVRAVANPFEYEEYRKKKLKERMEAKRASRIAPKESGRAKAKVNPELADRLHEKSDNTKAGRVARQVLSDDRFGDLFQNPDFEIDEDDHAFKLRNPSGVAANKKRKNDLDSDDEEDDDSIEASEESENQVGFVRVDRDVADSAGSDAESSEGSDEDGFAGVKVRGEMYEDMKKLKKRKVSKPTNKIKGTSKTIMYEADGLASSSNDVVRIGLGDSMTNSRLRRRHEELNMTVQERLAAHELKKKALGEATTIHTKGSGVSREVSFIPKGSQSKNHDKPLVDEASPKRRGQERRGIKELGFKTPFKRSSRGF